MPAGTKHTHHLNLKEETQLDLDAADPYAPQQSEDFDGKLMQAQQQLEYLQKQREQLEQQKSLLEDLTQRKEEFINAQIELGERLSTSLTTIDREVFELRQELEDLEQTRQSFAAHLERIERIEPESWPREMLSQELSRANLMLEQAEEEFEGAVAHFATGRTRGLFGVGRPGRKAKMEGEFLPMLKNGLAFNLPVISLGAIALLIYLVK